MEQGGNDKAFMGYGFKEERLHLGAMSCLALCQGKFLLEG